MMRFPMLLVVALLGAAVSVPAQISFEGKLGRLVRGSVAFGHRDNHNHQHRVPRDTGRHLPVPPRAHVPCPPPQPRGHWETVCEQVLVPGYWHEVHVPPTYGWVGEACGHQTWAIVDPGGCRRTWVPARWETRSRRQWVTC